MDHHILCSYYHPTFSLRVLLLSSFLLSAIANTGDNTILQNLKKAYPNWKPRGVVDVGANVGEWTASVQSIYDGMEIPTFMIEASPQNDGKLADIKSKFPHVDYKIALLSGEDDETVEFYSTGKTGDSMFKEQTKFYKDVKPELRKTSKLDTLIRHMEHVDYLKIDVQGAELLVLEGAEETLERVTFVQMEMSVVEYNKGGACWYELDNFLRSHGFYFYDAAGFFRTDFLFRTKGIGQFDSLYVKPSSSYLPAELNNALFCGANSMPNEKEDTLGDKNNNTLQENNPTTIIDNQKSEDVHVQRLTKLMETLTVFLVGFIAGNLRLRLFKAKVRVV